MKKLIITTLITVSIVVNATTTAGSVTIPHRVIQAIKADAAQEWPGDYELQIYTVDQQKAAYQQIATWLQNNRNNTTAKQIQMRASKEWPGDYEMQWYTIKEQITAYNTLNN